MTQFAGDIDRAILKRGAEYFRNGRVRIDQGYRVARRGHRAAPPVTR
jgi:hypothetical protein